MVLTHEQISQVVGKVVAFNENPKRNYDLHIHVGTGISNDISVRVIVYNRYIPDVENHTSAIYGSIQCDDLGCSHTFEQMMEFIDKYDNIEQEC